ncbi:uncharacterized protein LOC116418306 [Nasonia vitripennis]|uniref:BEN domain-containing protein n=1 Tax=Nasonia vitripennis TaxID=7425 RepID=A0A7M7QKK4_NASVI|nr:uncharacterized protein LOC116418306 [Nasonia vitripennis]
MKENVTLAKHVRLITDINQKRQALTHKSFNEIYPEDQSPNSKDQNKELATKTHSSQPPMENPMENLAINENAFEHLVNERNTPGTQDSKTLTDVFNQQAKILENQDAMKAQLSEIFQTEKGLLTFCQDLCENKVNLSNMEALGLRQGVSTFRINESNQEEIHLGRGVWLLKEKYDTAERNAVGTFAKFVRNLAVAVFGKETLAQSSVSGKSGPRSQDKDNEGGRLALSSTKLLALNGMYIKIVHARVK